DEGGHAAGQRVADTHIRGRAGAAVADGDGVGNAVARHHRARAGSDRRATVVVGLDDADVVPRRQRVGVGRAVVVGVGVGHAGRGRRGAGVAGPPGGGGLEGGGGGEGGGAGGPLCAGVKVAGFVAGVKGAPAGGRDEGGARRQHVADRGPRHRAGTVVGD